jgi:hypothetical protein
MSPGLAARSRKMLTHGTPGLVCVSVLAAAGWLSVRSAQYNPAVTKAKIATRCVVRFLQVFEHRYLKRTYVVLRNMRARQLWGL